MDAEEIIKKHIRRYKGVSSMYKDKLIKEMIKRYRKGELKAGGHTIANVKHDDWCDKLNGRGKCNCNPDIEYMEKGI